jgi:TonB family protein
VNQPAWLFLGILPSRIVSTKKKESNMPQAWKQWEGQVVNTDAGDFHFQLRQYLGGSEGGAVFLTELGPELPRVAIKLVPADAGNAEAQLSRWQRTIKLSHPHLLRVFQAGRCRIESTELLFVVMEYAEEDLSQILPERPLTPSETQEMLKATLAALAYLHGQGFVHGRVKPSNIMAIHDQLKLASDGLYAAGGPVAAQARSPYDPPEICFSTGQASGAITPAADVWSLGVTLTEVLTQHRPSWNETEQAEPVLPQILPEPFLDIVRNCLRHNPQQRWTIPSIEARLHPTSPVPSTQEPGNARAASTKRRYLALTVAAVVAALAAILAASGLMHRQAQPQSQPPSQIQAGAPVMKPEPKPDAPESEKPSPGTPLENQAAKNTAKNQELPSVAHPSQPVPSQPNAGTTTTSNPEHDGIVQQVLPEVPQKARDTIQGKIKVQIRVHVDAPGNVVEAELDSPGPSRYFAQLALQAAQRWKFTPAQAGAQDALREWLLRFEFGSAQTKVFPSPVVR